LATSNFLNDDTSNLSLEERNELDALDIIIGLSREERAYLLSIWRACPTTPALVRTEFRRATNMMRDRRRVEDGSGATF
jgi:hypothetical protein